MPHFTCNFLSYTLHRAMDIDVIIPGVTSTEAQMPGVTHKPAHLFPVLYLLHGSCNDYSTWERYTSIERYAEERRIAVVTFSGENNMYVNVGAFRPAGANPWIADPDYETLLVRELPDFVTNMFPVSKKREDTYIAGLSMGGYGALVNGYRHPEKFRAVGAFSPLPSLAVDINHVPTGNLHGYEKPFEPAEIIKKDIEEGSDVPDLYYCYGTEDFIRPAQDWFAKVLRSGKLKGLPYYMETLEGYGHEWAFWDLEVKKFLDWIPRTDPYYQEAKIRRI